MKKKSRLGRRRKRHRLANTSADNHDVSPPGLLPTPSLTLPDRQAQLLAKKTHRREQLCQAQRRRRALKKAEATAAHHEHSRQRTHQATDTEQQHHEDRRHTPRQAAHTEEPSLQLPDTQAQLLAKKTHRREQRSQAQRRRRALKKAEATAVEATAVDETAQAAAAPTPLDEDIEAASTVSIIKELGDHLYCRPTVQKRDQSVESSLQVKMSSPAPAMTVSHQEVIRFLLNRNVNNHTYRDQCGKNVFKHQRTLTGKKPYYCDQCGKCFRLKDSLKAHQMQIHAGVSPYQCDQCGKGFGLKYKLRIHQRIHTGEKPYQCDLCDKRFGIKYSLKSHLRSHQGAKPYQCDQCGKMFSQMGYLNTHLRTHTGEKPYRCDQCEKCFNTAGSLQSHKRLHTGEKPYHCDLCEKSFSVLGGLNYHTRHCHTHIGAKPFKCVCGKSFASRAELKLHRRNHTGEKPFKCKQCGQMFRWKQNFKTHQCN